MKIVHRSTIFSLLLASIMLLSAQTASAQQRGLVLIDKTHSEWGDDNPDRGYSDFAKALRSEGYTVGTLASGSITDAALAQVSVFVIPAPFTPPHPMSTDELSAISSFVSRGGGLLIAALGWSWASYAKQPVSADPANQAGSLFGITVEDNLYFDPRSNGGDPSAPVFINFALHPITEGLKAISVGSPSSLAVSGSAQPIVWGTDQAYTTGTTSHTPGSKPVFVAATQYGGGRVVYVGHDSIFYNRVLGQYDNLKFALNTISWLAAGSRAGAGGWGWISMPVLVLIIAVVVAATLALIMAKKWRTTPATAAPKPKEATKEQAASASERRVKEEVERAPPAPPPKETRQLARENAPSEIEITIVGAGKRVRMKVKDGHSAGGIADAAAAAIGKHGDWTLELKSRTLERQETVRDLRLNNGDELRLVQAQ